jgi:hypothetical protein
MVNEARLRRHARGQKKLIRVHLISRESSLLDKALPMGVYQNQNETRVWFSLEEEVKVDLPVGMSRYENMFLYN